MRVIRDPKNSVVFPLSARLCEDPRPWQGSLPLVTLALLLALLHAYSTVLVKTTAMLSLSTDVQRDFDSLVTPTTFVSQHSASLPHTVPLTDYTPHAFPTMSDTLYDPASPTPDTLLLNWHAAASSDIDTSVYSSHSSSPATSFRSTPPAQSPMEDKAYVVAAGLDEDPFEGFAFAEVRPRFLVVDSLVCARSCASRTG